MRMLLIASVAILGCGGKKDDGGASSSGKISGAPVEPAPPAPPVDKPADKPPADKPPADKPTTDTTHGTCRVVATGAVAFEQTSAHTGGSVLNVMQWHAPEMRAQMGYADEGMILNCLGDHVRLNVVTAKGASFPMKPAAYEVGGKDAVVRIMGQIEHPDGDLSVMKSKGNLEITAFDDKHIAGKGTLTVETLPKKGDVELAVTFDLQCYGLSGCK